MVWEWDSGSGSETVGLGMRRQWVWEWGSGIWSENGLRMRREHWCLHVWLPQYIVAAGSVEPAAWSPRATSWAPQNWIPGFLWETLARDDRSVSTWEEKPQTQQQNKGTPILPPLPLTLPPSLPPSLPPLSYTPPILSPGSVAANWHLVWDITHVKRKVRRRTWSETVSSVGLLGHFMELVPTMKGGETITKPPPAPTNVYAWGEGKGRERCLLIRGLDSFVMADLVPLLVCLVWARSSPGARIQWTPISGLTVTLAPFQRSYLNKCPPLWQRTLETFSPLRKKGKSVRSDCMYLKLLSYVTVPHSNQMWQSCVEVKITLLYIFTCKYVYHISLIGCCGSFFSLLIFVRLLFEGGYYSRVVFISLIVVRNYSHVPHILAADAIWGQYLFYSKLPMCSYYLRAASIRRNTVY